jgi:uncharacterized protein (DUF1778 family)
MCTYNKRSRTRRAPVLLDQRLFTFNKNQYDELLKALDRPPAPNAKLKRLMAAGALWKR